PEHNTHSQQHAARGNCRELIRSIQDRQDEKVGRNADSHPGEVDDSDDSCGGSESVRARVVLQSCLWLLQEGLVSSVASDLLGLMSELVEVAESHGDDDLSASVSRGQVLDGVRD